MPWRAFPVYTGLRSISVRVCLTDFHGTVQSLRRRSIGFEVTRNFDHLCEVHGLFAASGGDSLSQRASGAATVSSERRSASTAKKIATTAAASISPPPRAYPR